MCTEVNVKDLQTVHHEMGHIEYFMLYRHQPSLFRTGANAAFHEAVGDTIALSLSTPAHLRALGLMGESAAAPGGAGSDGTDSYSRNMALVVFSPSACLCVILSTVSI